MPPLANDTAQAPGGIGEAETDQDERRHTLEPGPERLEEPDLEHGSATPISTDALTWPAPHIAVTAAVRAADQRWLRARAANGTLLIGREGVQGCDALMAATISALTMTVLNRARRGAWHVDPLEPAGPSMPSPVVADTQIIAGFGAIAALRFSSIRSTRICGNAVQQVDLGEQHQIRLAEDGGYFSGLSS